MRKLFRLRNEYGKVCSVTTTETRRMGNGEGNKKKRRKTIRKTGNVHILTDSQAHCSSIVGAASPIVTYKFILAPLLLHQIDVILIINTSAYQVLVLYMLISRLQWMQRVSASARYFYVNDT